MGSRKINDLGASTFLFSMICDRALPSAYGMKLLGYTMINLRAFCGL